MARKVNPDSKRSLRLHKQVSHYCNQIDIVAKALADRPHKSNTIKAINAIGDLKVNGYMIIPNPKAKRKAVIK
jgi:hypothetical protein